MQLNKKNLYIIVQTIIFFMALGNVKAAPTAIKPYDINWSGGLTGAVKDASGVNNNQKRIVVCAYSCSNNNSGYNVGKCGNTGELWNTLTYQSKDTETNDWKINAGVILQEHNTSKVKLNITKILPGGDSFITDGGLDDPEIYVHEWTSMGVALPQTYYGKSTNDDKNQNWQNTTDSYKKLYESFVCPQYSYYDESAKVTYCSTKYCKEQQDDNTMELCYADDTSSCSTRNEDNYTSFNNSNPLAFSFAEQLNSVLERMSSKINSMTNEEILRPYGLPESEANSEQFLENICELLNQSEVTNQFASGTDKEDLLNKLIINSYTEIEREKALGNSNKCGDGTNITNISEYEKCLQENNSVIPSYYNKEIYNFNDLSQLLVQGKGKEFKNVIYNNESMSDKFNNIINNVYIEKLKSATASYQQQCEVKHGRKYDLDVNELGEEVKVSIEKIVSNYNKIDFDSLNCDNIFAGFAKEIKTAYFFLEILSIIIVIALSVLDYSKTILSDNQDEMKKSNQKLVKRLIILVVIFLLPAIINMTLKVFNIEVEGFNSDNPLCVKVKEK